MIFIPSLQNAPYPACGVGVDSVHGVELPSLPHEIPHGRHVCTVVNWKLLIVISLNNLDECSSVRKGG